MKTQFVLLPDTLYLKKHTPNIDISFESEEYTIYFKNILFPYDEKCDVVVDCKYGANFGHCWRLSNYTGEENEFDLTISVYDECGNKTISKTVKVILTDRVEDKKTDIIFIGDSMTFSQKYINHVFLKLHNLQLHGSRTLNGSIRHEGRGGWSYKDYFSYWNVHYGQSPFLFPKGIEAKDYYGCRNFVDRTKEIKEKKVTSYDCSGYDFGELRDGMYYVLDSKLYQKKQDGDVLVDENPQFEVDFAKYLERYNVKKPQIISLLLGANDLTFAHYETVEKDVNAFVENTKRMIDAIHKVDKNIAIIINLPILSAEQYAWGMQVKCGNTQKNHNFAIVHGCKALIDNFDNRQKENIYLSPMLACIDMDNGFDCTYVKDNLYSEAMTKVQSNWVHPNKNGYCQMGDAVAGVIEYIRNLSN